MAQAGEHVAFASSRKGHIKLALRYGRALVPCYCFGEADLYSQSRFAFGLRRWLVKRLGVCITLPLGRSILMPFLPRRVKLVHCVGDPIPVPQIEEPTEAQIDEYHKRYVDGLQQVILR